MQEISPENNENTVKEEQERVHASRSRESLWGALLFAFMLLFVVASIASIGWGVYSEWKNDRLEQSEPSIAVLSKQSEASGSTVASDETQTPKEEKTEQPEKQTTENDSSKVKKMIISVLNGGSIKGSAGVMTAFLKGEGYTNITPGNTIQDYTGTIVYYTDSLEKEAESIKTTLIKKYPQVKILPADVKNKETSVSQITIILGK